MKESTTDMTSVMLSLKKEIATMLESENNPRITNFLFCFFSNFFKKLFKVMFCFSNITSLFT